MLFSRARSLALFLVVGIATLILAGCGSGSSSTVLPAVQDPSASTTSTAATTPTPTPVATTGTLTAQAQFVAVAKTAGAANGLEATTATLVVHLIDGTGHDAAGLPASVRHTPGDTSTLTLGTVSAPGGAYTLIAVLLDANNHLLGLAQKPVTVVNGQAQTVTLSSSQAVTALAVTPQNGSVTVGGTQGYTATATLADASTVNATPLATWSSSDTAVATLSNAAATIGTATGVALGTATVTAAMGDRVATGTLLVSVTALSVTPQTTTIGTRGTQQLAATLTFVGGGTQDATSKATWSSSDTTVATVSTSGLVTAQGKGGTATITATLGGVSGQASITAAIGIDYTVRQAQITFRDVKYGNGLFVATDQINVLTSADGATWKQQAIPLTGDRFLVSVFFDGQQFFVMGNDGSGAVIMSSPDGAAWTKRAVTGSRVDSMVLNGQTYVAAGQNAGGATFTSTDGGVTWTTHATNTPALGDIAFGNGVYVATQPTNINSMVVYTSADAITFTQVQMPTVPPSTSFHASSVAFGNGTFVAVGLGGSGQAVYSTDGTNWTGVTTGFGIPQHVRWVNNRFFVVGQAAIATSPDGATWTNSTFNTTGSTPFMYGVAFGGNRYVAVGSQIATATDPATFTQVAGWGLPSGLPTVGFPIVPVVTAFANGVFVTANQSNAEVSADLSTFKVTTSLTGGGTAADIAFDNGELRLVTTGTNTMKTLTVNPDQTVTAASAAAPAPLRRLAFGAGTWVAVGDSGTIVTTPGGSLTMTTQTSGTTENLKGVAFGGGTFVACGANGALVSSPDGVTWTARTSTVTDTFQGVAFGNGRFIAASQTAIVTSTDGTTWTSLTNPSALAISSLRFADGLFWLGTVSQTYTSSDGAAWASPDTVLLGAYDSVVFGNGMRVLSGSPNESILGASPTLVIVSTP